MTKAAPKILTNFHLKRRQVKTFKLRLWLRLRWHTPFSPTCTIGRYWGPDKENQPKTVDGFKDFNHTNVCKSLIILLNEFFPGENCDKTINWEVVEDHSHKVTFRKNNASDHHLNMLHRLSLHSFFFIRTKFIRTSRLKLSKKIRTFQRL